MPAIAFPNIDPVAFSLGPLQVRWYGLAYFAGILLGWLYARRLVSNERLWGGRTPPITVADIDDLLLWMTLGIIVGGRLGHVLFYDFGRYLDDPLAMLQVWRGGMSFHGGLLGTILAMVIFGARRKLPVLSLLDVTAAAAPIGLCLGRLANFVNGELWGRVTETPWGMVFCNDAIRAAYGDCPAGLEPRHPSQLYEAALEGLFLFLVLRLLTHRFGSLRRPGLTGGAFVGGYGLCRILVEFVREPDAQIGTIGGFATMGMLLSLPMVVIGLGAAFWAARRSAA